MGPCAKRYQFRTKPILILVPDALAAENVITRRGRYSGGSVPHRPIKKLDCGGYSRPKGRVSECADARYK
jgi:hypothetical protein